LVFGFVSARLVGAADAVQQIRQVDQMLGNEMLNAVEFLALVSKHVYSDENFFGFSHPPGSISRFSLPSGTSPTEARNILNDYCSLPPRMDVTTATTKLLSEISDEGLFERLATAVLREADPRYAALVHPGVNADGRTVKGPLDGVSFVSGSNPVQLVAVHHTTTKASDLQSKWLHDPATVKPRKGRRPTAPPGDLLKTANVVAEERRRAPRLEATLVLTTNQEPPVDLVGNVEAAARNCCLKLDLWPRSRIAHFLDKREGQWIRRTFLSIEPDRLSSELLSKLSRDSAHNFRPLDHSDAWVDRSLDNFLDEVRSNVVFIVAESGFGKTVACYKHLIKHIDQGGFGIILPHEILENALNVDQAVENALRQLHPELSPNLGDDIRSVCDRGNPLLVVVEDINRSARGAQLLEKLANWTSRRETTGEGPSTTSSWRLLCPVWPELLLSLKDQARKRVESMSMSCPALTLPEARLAVQRRSALLGRIFTDLEADAIAAALGHDPLLIALHDPSKTPDAFQVVDEFVEASLLRTAMRHPEWTAPDYRAALTAMSQAMLSRRQLEPAWTDIIAWFGLAGGMTQIIRRLLEDGEILRLSSEVPSARLRFRHDRVRDSLLSNAVAEMIRSQALDETFLSDPFFAEVIGGALIDQRVGPAFMDRAVDANPLAVFHAFRRAGNPDAPKYRLIVDTIGTWLNRDDRRSEATRHLMWHAVGVLAQMESPDVITLIKRMPVGGTTAQFARLRNGDIFGGIELCQKIDFGSIAPWRDSQIEHAKARFGKRLISELAEILQQIGLGDDMRAGALRLAGHLADPALFDAIAVSWEIDEARGDHLQDYLWAGAQCCSDQPAKVLGPVCDAWAALSNVPEKEHHSSPRNSLAAYNVRYGFQQWPPVRAIKYLIERASQTELNWPITFLLHGLDNPDSLEFTALQLANTARRQNETGSFSPLAMSATDRWDPDRRRGATPMSHISKSHLLKLWTGPTADSYLREQAFRLWSASQIDGDLTILREIDSSDNLYSTALFQRIRRSDITAIPALLEKIKTERESYWWQAGRYLWSDALTEALDESFVRRGETAERIWDAPETLDDWITSENLLRLHPNVAENLLVKHWDHLRYAPNFVHAALFVATPRLRQLADAAIAECSDQRKLMEHIDTHYNIKPGGGSGVTRLEQVEALVPYFGLLSDAAIDHFWRLCNDRGWFELRRVHLDSRLTHLRYTELLGEENTFRALDEFVAKDRLHSIDHYLDRLLTAGVTLDQAVKEFSGWLISRGTIDALRVMAAVLVHIGRRIDLPILRSMNLEPSDAADDIITDTTFAVMRRTLH
jgi:hypothetical protein